VSIDDVKVPGVRSPLARVGLEPPLEEHAERSPTVGRPKGLKTVPLPLVLVRELGG
jgi:hypothetical protein